MRITIIGAGNMGRGIGVRAVAGGNEVELIDQNPQDARSLANELGSAASTSHSISGEIVVLAVPYEAVAVAIKQHRDGLAGKVLIDIANPVDWSTMDRVVTPEGSSSAEEAAKLVPESARVVKAFNTTFAKTLVAGEVAGQTLEVLIAGDDAGAKQMVGSTVSLIRSDDPLAAVEQAAIDVALVRGAIPGSAPVRRVHLFDEVRVAVCSEHSKLATYDSLDWSEVPEWPLVVNVVSGTTGPWSWPDGEGPRRIVETRNFDEWLESVAADRGIGVVPDVAMRRNIHSAVRFVPLTNAPASPVFLAFLPHVREALMRQFVGAAVAAVTAAGSGSPAHEPGTPAL